MNLSKSLLRIASVISLWLMTGCMAEAASAQPQQDPYALIYNGPVSDGDSTRAIADVVRQVGLPVRYLSNIEALPAELDHARVFIVGGTEDDVEPLLNAFTPDARSALKTYLQNGGRYLGICGGAFVASTGWSEEEGFVPALGLV
ncbi:MAG: BPL-N domain-containing protein, partial [Shewanella sp.]